MVARALGLDDASLWILSVIEDDSVRLFCFLCLWAYYFLSLFLSSESKTQAGSFLLLARHLQSSGIDSLLRRLVVYHLSC